jgi:hypothetical protein
MVTDGYIKCNYELLLNLRSDYVPLFCPKDLVSETDIDSYDDLFYSVAFCNSVQRQMWALKEEKGNKIMTRFLLFFFCYISRFSWEPSLVKSISSSKILISTF